MTQPIQYPPRAFSPQQRAGSPQSPYPPGQPPPKRPQIPSNGQPHYGSPSMANIQLPNQVFSGPYRGSPVNGTSPGPNYPVHQPFTPNSFNPHLTYNSLNTPAPPPANSLSATSNNVQRNAMGPPSRPDNRPADLNELGDVLFGAGVDLKEEEAALLQTRDNNQNSSFEDQLREASGASSNAQYPFARGNFYSQNYPGGRDSFFGGGILNQPAQKEQTADERAEAERKQALRKQAEIRQYHLNRPFLLTGNLQRRVYKEAGNVQVQVPIKDHDILRPTQPKIAPQSITVRGPDGHDVVKVVQGEPLLGLKNSLADILTLMSLATEERLRTIVEDSATLAKGRRIGAHGLVPQDMLDLAKKTNGDAAATLPTPENSVVSPKENTLKRSYSEMNTPQTPVASHGMKGPQNAVAQALQRLARAERTAEEARLVKRKKRAEAADGSPAGSGSLGASEPGTPATLPDAPIEMPKKSALKNQKKAPTEQQAFAASNNTMRMALGLGSAMGKKLAWMQKDTGPSNPYLQKPKVDTKKSDAANALGSNLPKSRNFGNFREDGEGGAGIQVRDVISVLEHDGKEKKALQRAYAKLESKG
ncbi:uncharacterized protein KY384_006700 [Bacidia gigantensis]|uniref:uncharacterized protein n=1 Tax=Bacidia gigantensis TaxID=2732470 RepID=UPI001D043D7A|nr:uncharacterized protein KY384_006700 [Bacidia gigantensis]KAG8529011.1 hypothetical protein KY384_006700 [Bacidia gigantensis]